MIELAIGTALLAALVWWRVVIEWRAYKLRKAERLLTVRITADVTQYVAALQQLIEPTKRATQAIGDFVEVWNRPIR